MFDIGFGELLLIAVVALLVLGPERLPRAAKMSGLMLRRARASWFSVKAQFERELADEELKRSLQATRAEFDGLRDELKAPLIGLAGESRGNSQPVAGTFAAEAAPTGAIAAEAAPTAAPAGGGAADASAAPPSGESAAADAPSLASRR